MTNEQVNRLASEVIDASNAAIARLDMQKDGSLSPSESLIYQYHGGRISVAQAMLDMGAAERRHSEAV